MQQVVPPVQVEDGVTEPNVPEEEADDDLPPPVFPKPGNRAGIPRRPNVFRIRACRRRCLRVRAVSRVNR